MRPPTNMDADRIREVVRLLRLALQDCYKLLQEIEQESRRDDRSHPPVRRPN